jgi:hypothetical protein
MPKKRVGDPIRKYQRKSRAARRLAGQSCACGEARPEALVAGSVPTICAACARKRRRQSPLDRHHPAGKANNPATVAIPVNDHRANLSVAQYDWPKDTWKNPLSSPLLAGAACIRGFCDTITYLIDELLLWVARLLEALDEHLKKRLGPKWWLGTEMDQFTPKR